MLHLSQGQIQELARSFSEVNRQFLGGNRQVRYTLLWEDPNDAHFIIPSFRWKEGVTDPIAEAASSRARFALGESRTGRAWRVPHVPSYHPFPPFESEDEIREYHARVLEPDRSRANLLSSFMIDVRTFCVMGFKTFAGAFLADLTIDLPAQVIAIRSQRSVIFHHVTAEGVAAVDFFDALLAAGLIRGILSPP